MQGLIRTVWRNRHCIIETVFAFVVVVLAAGAFVAMLLVAIRMVIDLYGRVIR